MREIAVWIAGARRPDPQTDVGLLAFAKDQATADRLTEAIFANGMAENALALRTRDRLQ